MEIILTKKLLLKWKIMKIYAIYVIQWKTIVTTLGLVFFFKKLLGKIKELFKKKWNRK